MSMHYLEVSEARGADGLRLVLTAGLPGPWGEAIKSVLAYKGIEFTPVAQYAGEENAELLDWTGQASAPVLVYKDEAPRVSWLDQLMFAEQMAPGRPLLPDNFEQRALAIGLCREVAGENGLGWLRRLELLGPDMGHEAGDQTRRMANRYGWTEQAHATATARAALLLGDFALRLAQQARGGSEYLVGETLSAADLYLANFIGMYHPLPETLNPMPAYLREIYSRTTPELQAALGDGLLAWRDQVVARHIDTPLQF